MNRKTNGLLLLNKMNAVNGVPNDNSFIENHRRMFYQIITQDEMKTLVTE